MKKKWLAILILATAMSLMPVRVFAASCEGVDTALISCGDSDSGIGHILSLVLNIASVGVAVAGVIGIVVAGLQYITAADNEEQTRKAKRRIFEIVIGLAAYVLIYLVLAWLLPGGSLNPGNIEYFEVQDSTTMVGAAGGVTWNNAANGGNAGDVNASGDTGGTPGSAEIGSISETATKIPYAAIYEKRNYDGVFDYWLNVPEGATTGMPLVVFLHGSGEVGRADAVANLPQARALKGRTDFISVVPVATRNWTNGSTPASIKGLIDQTMNEYQSSKVYIMGFSLGAIGTWNMIDKYPDLFAAAVPISCCSPVTSAANFTRTKIWAIVGSKENGGNGSSDYVSCMTNFVNAINAAGGSAKLETYAGQSHATMSGNLRYGELFDWMLQQ